MPPPPPPPPPPPLRAQADGKDAYATAKELGVFKIIKRTEGISTTDIVGRMLLMNRDHHVRTGPGASAPCRRRGAHAAPPLRVSAAARACVCVRSVMLLPSERRMRVFGGAPRVTRMCTGASADEAAARHTDTIRTRSASIDRSADVRISTFLPTSRRIVQFAEGKAPKEGDRVVYAPPPPPPPPLSGALTPAARALGGSYMCGAFDLFNAGHIMALKVCDAHRARDPPMNPCVLPLVFVRARLYSCGRARMYSCAQAIVYSCAGACA